MANVTEYLAQILSARYGKEVRQSIHDGIKAINDEVVDYGTTASQSAEEAAKSAEEVKASITEAQEILTELDGIIEGIDTDIKAAEDAATSAKSYSEEAATSASNAQEAYEKSQEIYDNFSSAGSVTGVKGNAETSYRSGQVNITPANLGITVVNNTADKNKSVKHATTADSATQATQDSNGDTIASIYLKKDGDAANNTVTFSQAGARTELGSGEKLSSLFGKIKKWLADLKTVAFTGSYDDLEDTPSIANNLTTTEAGSVLDARQGKELKDLVEDYSQGFTGVFNTMYNDILTNYVKKSDLKTKGSYRLHFMVQAGWLVSTTATYLGDDLSSITVASGSIIGERPLEEDEITKLNSALAKSGYGFDFMTSDSDLVTELADKIVQVVITA